MNGNDLLVDTNILIQINQGIKVVEPILENNLAISFITEIELLGGLNFSKELKNQYKNLINDCYIFEFNRDIKEKTIFLRNNYKLKIPDAIIASTAIVFDLPLVSSDADFIKIIELNFIFLEK
jgi:predicted nucleic acid-binding protein